MGYKHLTTITSSEMSRKPKGFWDNFKNIESELLPICVELGYMPSTKQLE